jgi:uncharacterized hydrophobic protein (TIGR00271 family)
VVHLRIVAPREKAEPALDALEACPTVINVMYLRDAAHKPDGDVIMCDVAREDASVVIADLKALNIHREGSIAVEDIATTVSEAAEHAEKAAEGAPSDAVVWEEVSERTSEESYGSATFYLFIVLAAQIASVGIYLNSAILIVGAMVVGPEFGPIAAFCVAAVERRRTLALRSFAALAVGFPLAIGAVVLTSLIFKATGISPDEFNSTSHSLARTIASPDFFAAFVAFCAGIAGMLSLTTAKSGALIGVSAVYGDWHSFWGSLEQLGLNIASLLVAGTLTLTVQRVLYHRRRAEHEAQQAAARKHVMHMPQTPVERRRARRRTRVN